MNPERSGGYMGGGTFGKKIYYKYGCVSCHGTDGVGTADLRQCTQHYPHEDQLLAWIKNAPSFKPDTKMPCWDGVIADNELPPLICEDPCPTLKKPSRLESSVDETRARR